jgi:hypothetical protein
MQNSSGPLLGDLAAAVIAGGGLDLRVAGQLLDRAQVDARVQQVGDERAAQVVGRKGRHLRSIRTPTHEVQHGLGAGSQVR